MLERPHPDHTTDLDEARRRVDRAAGAAALAFERHFRRAVGMALIRVAQVNGTDYEVERLNDRLRVSGRSDPVASASARLSAPVEPRVVDALALALTSGVARGGR